MAEEGLSDTFRSGSFPEGTMLGRYRLEWFVCRNCAGEMYSAVDTESNKSCCLTVVFPSVSKHAPEIADLLLRRAQEACFFSHKNMLRVQEGLSLPGCHCIVTEYFSAESAEQLLLKGPLPENQVLSIAAQLASLMAAAEPHSDLIPDFTPDTVCIDRQGEVKIFYPGFKRFLHLLPGNVIGAEKSLLKFPAFTAPEVLLGKGQPGFSSAMYSLGMLMCFLLCGKTPCDGENICQAIAAVTASKPCSPGPTEPPLSPHTLRLISSLTAPVPAQRPASGSELMKLFGKNAPRRGGIVSKLLIRGSVGRTMALAAALVLIVAGGLLLYGKFSSPRKTSGGTAFLNILRGMGNQGQALFSRIFGKDDELKKDLAALDNNSSSAAPEVQSVPQNDSSADSGDRDKTAGTEKKPQPENNTESAPAESTPAENRSAQESTDAEKTPAVQKKEYKLPSPPPPQPNGQNFNARLSYCRSRLQTLQKELDAGDLDPRVLQLHRKRIEFRQRQIMTMTARRRQLENRRAERSSANKELNSRLRLQVEAWLKRFHNAKAFMQHRADLRQGRTPSFPIEKLEAQGVDFTTRITIPRALQHTFAHSPANCALGTLLLEDILLPASQGAKLLARLKAPLPEIRLQTIFALSANHRVDNATLRYLITETVQDKNRYSVVHFLQPESKHFRSALLLEQFLLSSGLSGSTFLFHAVGDKNDDPSLTRVLLEAEALLECRDREGRTPLFHAFICGNRRIAGVLRAAGANEKHQDRYGKSAEHYQMYGDLFNGIRRNNIRQISAALSAGADPNFTWRNGRTPLIEACASGKHRAAALLLDKGADPNKYAADGTLPLASCVPGKNGSLEVLKCLLAKRADPNRPLFRHRPGETFLSRLCRQYANHPQAESFAETLLQNGKCKVRPNSLFHVCRSGNSKLFRMLIEKGPALNGPAYRNLVAEALKNRMPPSIIRTLLSRGAPKPDDKQLDRLLSRLNSPEMNAIFDEKPKLPSRSFRRSKYTGGPGVPLNNSYKEDEYAQIIKQDQADRLGGLLARHALNPDSIVHDMTLMQLAARNDSAAVVSVLLKHNADPFKFTLKNRMTAILIAAANGNLASFTILAGCTPPGETTHLYTLETIWKQKSSEAFLRIYLQKHGRTIKRMPHCFLTLAIKDRAPEGVLLLLLNFYESLDDYKHRSVVHQAVASGASLKFLSLLRRSKASFRNKAPVWIYDAETEKGNFHTLTPIETAKRVKADKDIVRMLQKSGRR